MTDYIVNAGFDEDLTWKEDGSKKGLSIRTTTLSNRSIAYVTEDGSLYATVNPNTPNNRPDGRTLDATNGFIGQIKGWDAEKRAGDLCEWVYFGTVPYSLQDEAIPIADDGSSFMIVPARPTEFEGGSGALYLRAGWGGQFSYKQEVSLPCAKYRLEYWTINVNPNTNGSATDLSKITCMHDVFAEEGGDALSAGQWTKHEFEFTPLTTFTIEFGMKVSNAGSGSTPWVFIDGIKLYKVGEADPVSVAANELYYYVDVLDSYKVQYDGFNGLNSEIGRLQKEIEGAIASNDLDIMDAMIASVESRIATWDLLMSDYNESVKNVQFMLENNDDAEAFLSSLEDIIARAKDAESEDFYSLIDELQELRRQIAETIVDSSIVVELFGVDGKTLVKNEPIYLYNIKAGQFIASGPWSSRGDLAVFCEDRLPLCFEIVDTVQLAANGIVYEGVAIKSYNNPFSGESIRPTQLGVQVNTSHVFLRYHDTANLLIPVFTLGESAAGYFTLTTASNNNLAYVGFNPREYNDTYNSTVISCNVGLTYDGSIDWAIIPASNAEAFIATLKNRIARADLQKTFDEVVFPYYSELKEQGEVSDEFNRAISQTYRVLANASSSTEEINSAKTILVVAMNHAKFSKFSVSEEVPVNVTDFMIENPDFEAGTTIKGWTIDGIYSAQNMGYQGASYSYNNVNISNFIEVWQPSSVGKLSDGFIYQTIFGLPAGRYILQVSAMVGEAIEYESIEGVYLAAQDKSNLFTTAISANDNQPHNYELLFDHDGADEITIGIKLQNATTNWVAADNFRLICIAKEDSHSPVTGDDMTVFIVNAGFDEDLTWFADGSKKGEAVSTTVISDRSVAYETEDGSVYATVNPNTPMRRPDGRTYEATNGFIGQMRGWEVETTSENRCEWIYFGAVPYDLMEEAIPVADDGTTYLPVPERPDGNPDNTAFLYLRAGWGASGTYNQTINLPTGKYRLDYMAYLGNDNTVDISSIYFRGRVQTPDAQNTVVNSWSTYSVEFIANGDFTIQFGVSSSNSLSRLNPILWIDNLSLKKIGDATEKDVYIDDIYYYVNASGKVVEDYAGRFDYDIMEPIYLDYNNINERVNSNDLQTLEEEELIAILEEVKSFYTWLTDESNFIVDNTLLGDANCDGAVDIVDVTTIVDFILERDYPNDQQWINSDVNFDGSIDVVDLTSTVQIILGTYNGAYGAKNRTLSTDALLFNGSDITLTNSRDYVAFQMDVTLTDGASLCGAQLSDRGADHSLAYRKIGENTYRILAYSVDGSAFSGNYGSLVTLDIEGGSLKAISSVVFSDGVMGYTLNAGDATGVNTIAFDGLEMNNVYDLAGRRVTKAVKGGLYLINGKKVLVR